MNSEPTDAALERAYRDERAQVLATLIGRFGDLDLAEEALQDAWLAALEHWRTDGIPANPGAWLTTAARRKAIDRIRRSRRTDQLEEELTPAMPAHDHAAEVDEIPDERLKLMFTCCHPALPLDQQIALTLHTLGGLSTEQIASAFLLPVPTLAQRLVRAKKKIRDAGIPFYIPPTPQLAERLASVCHVIYLIFSEGYAASSGDQLMRHDLADEAIRLGRVLELLMRRAPAAVPMPLRAEVLGLLALMLLHHARRAARVDATGALVLLEDQDRAKWSSSEIRQGLALLDAALQLRAAGPYQIQACISAVHAHAARYADTDWAEIASLYGVLLNMSDTPVIRVNHAVAVAMSQGALKGLQLLDAMTGTPALESYVSFHAARADLLRRLGDAQAARAAYASAMKLCENGSELAFFQRRMRELA